MSDEIVYLAAVITAIVLMFAVLYVTGERAIKKRKIDTQKETEEFEKISISVTGKKVDTSKTEIVTFTVSVPIIFSFKHKVTARDNVDGSEYGVEIFDGKVQNGMIITPYEVRIYNIKEVAIVVTVATKNLYKKEKNEIIDI